VEKPFLWTFGDEQKDLTQLGKKVIPCIIATLLVFSSNNFLSMHMQSSDHSGRRETVQQKIFKGVDKETLAHYTCPKCKRILRDAVQPACGHRICQSCADEILAKENSPCCPECGDNFDKEDGAYVSSVYCLCLACSYGQNCPTGPI
jgi:hypothetical protein